MSRRLAAARGYGGFRGRQDFGEAVGMSPSTQQRVESGKRTLRDGELLLISRRCGVPEWFLEGGWEAYPTAGAETETLDPARELVASILEAARGVAPSKGEQLRKLARQAEELTGEPLARRQRP